MKKVQHSTLRRLSLLLLMGILLTGCGDGQPRNVGMFNHFSYDIPKSSGSGIFLISEGVFDDI